VELDLNNSTNHYFSPVSGVFKRKVNDGRFEYLGAVAADKEQKKRKIK